jgi:quercetin dioxygenase-like cupin family protein
MNAIEISLRYRQMAPLHVHTEDEELTVLEGRLAVYAGGTRVELGPGEAWVAPAGVPHTYRAETSHVRLVATSAVRAPGRYEDFLRAVAEPSALTPEDEANLAMLAGANGIAVLAEPGALPAQP